MRNIYAHLLDKLKDKKPLALATIVETKGSTPQVPGASAFFSSKGLLEGTLGGGLLEADAQRKALKTLKKKVSLLSEFSLKADISEEEGAICGGEVKILIDASPEEHTDAFRDLSQSLFKRKPGILATFINRISEEKVSIFRHWIERKDKLAANQNEPLSFFKEEIKRAFSEGRPFFLKIKKEIFPEKAKERFLFLEPVLPLPQLVIAGAGHIGQVVTHLGSLLNFEVTVIDDRPEFANKEKLPDADHIIVDEIGRAIQNFPVSSDTYLVIVTRGHKHDGVALRQCITSDAAYIGLIGSIRKIKLMRKKFLEEGWATPRQFDRACAPIGIDIRSKTVEEIAVSIAAQLVLVRSQIQGERKDIKWSGP
jgi:xanthine dehydrogenase accessory factor